VEKSAFFPGFLALATIVLALSCSNPADSGASSIGSITGVAHYSGSSGNASILVSAELSSKGICTTVAEMLASKAPESKALGKGMAAQATTDASGVYTLSGLAEGSYTVYASSSLL